MKTGTVAVGYVFDTECATSFMLSLKELRLWEATTTGRIPLGPDGELAHRYYSDGLSAARNAVVERFLKGDCEWLFWVDTDMGFAPDILNRLLSVADKDTRPIVGGLCFMQNNHAQDGKHGFLTHPQVTIFDWVEQLGRRYLESRRGYPVNTLVECDGTGSACVVIHRSVFEDIKTRAGNVWYDRITNPTTGVTQSEDLSFCVRAERPVYVYTAAKTSHLKSQWVQEEHYWDHFLADPADEPVAVVVPVMERPQNAAPFMRTLRASTGWANVYAIADPHDTATQTAWADAGAEVIISDRGYTFAQKVNCGYLHTDEPNLLFVGDDVHFHPGWYDHALHVLRADDAGVVSTLDLGNSAVMAGEHAVHPMMTRRYIDEHGASWDGPKTVAHEGYGHWYVDNEWTYVAKQNRAFTVAMGSIVEHLHPLWGRAKMDDTYIRGQRSVDADRRLWERRLREYGAAA